MNTFNCGLLIRDPQTRKKIEKRQRLKTIFFWSGYLVLMIYAFGIVPIIENPIASVVLSLCFIGTFAAVILYSLLFFRFVQQARKYQLLDTNDPIDGLIAEINRKYDGLVSFRKMLYLIDAAAFIIGIVLLVIGGALAGAAENAAGGSAVGTVLLAAGMLIVFLGIFVTEIVALFRQIKFVQSISSEAEQIQNRFFADEGLTPEEIQKKRPNVFTNIQQNEKVLGYQYPDEILRKKIRKMSLYMILPAFVIGLFLGFTIVTDMSKIEETGNATGLYIKLAICCALFVATIALSVVRQRMLQLAQKRIFDADAEKYKYHLELYAATRKNQKLNNYFMLVSVLALCALYAIVIIFGQPLLPEEVVGMIFAGVLLWLLLSIAFLIPATILYRKKARPIEAKIDEYLAIQAQKAENPADVIFSDMQ